MKIIKQYFWIIKNIWASGKGILCLYVLSVFLMMVIPTLVSFFQQKFVSSLESSSPMLLVIVLLLAYVMIKFINSVYQYVDSYFAHKFIYKTNFIFNTYFTKSLYKEPQQSFYSPAFNDRLNKIRKGKAIIPFQVFSINEIVISIIVLVFIQIPLIARYSSILLILIVLASLPSLFTAKKFAKAQHELEQKLTRDQRKADYFGGIFSSKTTAKEIRIFLAQNFFFEKWSKTYTDLNENRNAFEIRKQKFQMIFSLWDSLANCALLMILFIHLMKKQIDFGSFIFLYTIVPVASGQLKALFQAIKGNAYANYLDIQYYVDYVEDCNIKSTNHITDFETLELKDVSYMYPTGVECAVKNASFSIKKGEIVSILGFNGSGKTTLTKLITGVLSPTQGSVYINGEEVNNNNKNKFSCIWGIAYQDFTRYLLSVADNIGYGYIEKYNEDNINKAGEEAECHALFAKLPNGLNSLVGKTFYDEGIDLSGGEWQKLTLARAYMGDHNVLILDEPTAAIDPLKEMEMLLHFKDVLKDRTAILISHRIGFARLADRIIMMDNGKIVESGTHDELLRLNGLYAKLFNAQKELYI